MVSKWKIFGRFGGMNICIICIYIFFICLFIDTVVVCVTVHVYVQMSTYMYYTKCDMYVQKSHMYLQIDILTYVYINTTYAFKLQFKESISLIYILMYLQPCHMEFFHKTFFLLRGGRAKKSLKLDVFFSKCSTI